mmetsp:Transcript_15221/g.16927  ORF Transcript_15221/g.16927 Transcript_15221/m.16927 type:complete len:102 (+) Transcript_15221:40-345(+)
MSATQARFDAKGSRHTALWCTPTETRKSLKQVYDDLCQSCIARYKTETCGNEFILYTTCEILRMQQKFTKEDYMDCSQRVKQFDKCRHELNAARMEAKNAL